MEVSLDKFIVDLKKQNSAVTKDQLEKDFADAKKLIRKFNKYLEKDAEAREYYSAILNRGR